MKEGLLLKLDVSSSLSGDRGDQQMIAVGGRGRADDAGVSQNSDPAVLLGSVTGKEYHNVKNILLCLESRGRMQLRGNPASFAFCTNVFFLPV